MMIMMMGTAGENIPKAPKEKTVFVEDLTDTDIPTGFPPGLENLGNTCYMNSTIQCLKAIPELKQQLMKMESAGQLNPNTMLSRSLRDLFARMDNQHSGISPGGFLSALRQVFPRFAARDDHGGFMQQDAQECWTEIVNCINRAAPGVNTSDQNNTFVKQYLGLEMDSKIQCLDSPDEPATTEKESQFILSCNITTEVNHLVNGIKLSLQNKLEKTSPTTGSIAQYQKTSGFSRLPNYLTIQYVRFYWKASTSTSAKILRNVKFPLELDMYEFSTPELQAKLKPARQLFVEQSERDADSSAKAKADDDKVKMDADQKTGKKSMPSEFADDTGSNNSGFYELKAVLTHKGRSSDSGHYVAWVRSETNAKEWMLFDDDKVTSATEEQVLALSGGGDWHMAYILLYGPKVLKSDADLA
ncbi:hypothetical protein SARC_12220 [Sphaeroforma arctica JP610]|uniref:Ubiquitin carboxyl-terminal hydrolase n=1 Tax=Sphaeroforma arctica JP610 TaxID=667725 RepID=A0A0L0FER0_9EUKA|nr:hypothetical protein SARC_12220 [Sphaeroforma arctica JP610]KNC75252.1 hypothetical protein SARC_12220 [Sphaeroforma arctica JP610]|eukprot:XP_014149154.1 hypothetical protein SARC_12220 [Sphaeroforma arctica JP610]